MKDAEVLEHMQNGWELGLSDTIRRRHTWLQKGGLGKGGESLTVSEAAVNRLLKKGIITKEKRREGDSFWLHRYALLKYEGEA